MVFVDIANANTFASTGAVSDQREAANASKETEENIDLPLPRPHPRRNNKQRFHHRARRINDQLRPCHPERHPFPTPKDREQSEEERRMKLLGWFDRREAAKLKAAENMNDKNPLDTDAIEGVAERNGTLTEWPKMRRGERSASAGTTPSGRVVEEAAHFNLSCKDHFGSTLH